MIFTESKLFVIDNCGAKVVKCIKILGKSGKRVTLGTVILVAIQNKLKTSKNIIFTKKVYFGLIIHLRYPTYRLDGVFICFKKNSLVLLASNLKLLGSRILKPLVKELNYKFKNLLVKAKLIF
jgi:large subunit ribosomal protein L14